jgi:hypothetical protein
MKLTAMPKYVASRSLERADWRNSTTCSSLRMTPAPA